MKKEQYMTLLVLMLIVSVFAGSVEMLRSLVGDGSQPWVLAQQAGAAGGSWLGSLFPLIF